MQLAKCNTVIGKSQFYSQFFIIVCARFCSHSMWTYLLDFCKITIWCNCVCALNKSLNYFLFNICLVFLFAKCSLLFSFFAN